MGVHHLANSLPRKSSRDGQKLPCKSFWVAVELSLIDSVQGYGMTETNAYVCSVAGGDYLERVSWTIHHRVEKHVS